MAPDQGIHFADFVAEYDATLTRAQQIITGFPPMLRELAELWLPQLCGGTFSQIVALLPYWVADLLNALEPPRNPPSTSQRAETETLGVANLLGWWFHLIQDWLLDRDLDQPELLPLSTAFYAGAVRLFERLLPGDKAFWRAFETLSLISAEACCWEQHRRFRNFAEVEDRGLLRAPNTDDPNRLADRSTLLRLTTVAQMSLHGYGQAHPLCTALTEMLRHYAIARQIGDDLTDWVDDLNAGCLNYVSTRIMWRMKEKGAIQSYAELDIGWMAGYFLYDDELLADIQHVALAACEQAAQSIASYSPLYLGALVAELRARLETGYQVALDERRTLWRLYSPLKHFS